MEAVNRRSTLALGLTVAATPLITWATPATAETYGPDEGEEIGPSVRVVALSERVSIIPAYKRSSCGMWLSNLGRRRRTT